MNITYLIELLTNRLNGLMLAKDQAFSSGDLDRINTVDAEILDVQNTLSKLNLLLSIEQAAATTPFTEAQVVQNGIEASFNPTVINDATKCLLEFNIEPYATDPEHEMKIQGILERMPLISTPEFADIYIKKSSPSSLVTGQMVINSSTKYNVDARLMLAIMELDSRFGTEGVGARTFNPGNVGNTGTAERMYPSWDEGVDAVASWLNRHRRVIEAASSTTSLQTNTVEKVTKKVTVKSEDTATTQEDEVIIDTPIVEEPVLETSTTTDIEESIESESSSSTESSIPQEDTVSTSTVSTP